MVEIGRIKSAAARFGDRFLHRVFTRNELSSCPDGAGAWAYLAGRFAAKEAAYKALGGFGTWREIEILKGPSGGPVAVLSGSARKRAEDLKGSVSISISHCREYAVAVALLT